MDESGEARADGDSAPADESIGVRCLVNDIAAPQLMWDSSVPLCFQTSCGEQRVKGRLRRCPWVLERTDSRVQPLFPALGPDLQRHTRTTSPITDRVLHARKGHGNSKVDFHPALPAGARLAAIQVVTTTTCTDFDPSNAARSTTTEVRAVMRVFGEDLRRALRVGKEPPGSHPKQARTAGLNQPVPLRNDASRPLHRNHLRQHAMPASAAHTVQHGRWRWR
eukprot:scaffold26360_cov60-Phaeocystis_antarctica.AAC.3